PLPPGSGPPAQRVPPAPRGGGRRDGFAAFGLAVVEAAGQLADDQDVDTVAEDFRLERRGADQGRVQDDGAQVGEEAFAQAEQCDRLRALLWQQSGVAGRIANGAEVDGVAGAAELDRLGREGGAGGVDGGPADERLARLEPRAEPLLDAAQDLQAFGD